MEIVNLSLLKIEPEPSSALVMQSGSVAEWATAFVAFIALVLSALAFITSRMATRRSSFMALEERLIAADAAQGRREIYRIKSVRHARRLHRRHSVRWDRANHAVVLLNKLAQYTQSGLVDRGLALNLWGDVVAEAWPNLEHIVRYRRSLGRRDKWSSLVWFAKKAGADVPADLDD